MLASGLRNMLTTYRLGVLILACCFAPCFAWADETRVEPLLQYPASSDFVVLELTARGSATIDPRQGPFVRIHGDGRVHVRHPPHFRDSGDYEVYLSPGDLQTLLSFGSELGLMSFDREFAEKELEAAAARYRARTGTRPGITDASTTTLRIRLSRYGATETSSVVEDFETSISWYGLSEVTSWYPDVEPLVRFQRFVEVLRLLQTATVEASKRGEATIWLPASVADEDASP